MRKFKLLSVAAILMATLTQCIDETYFGESAKANIEKFTIEGELSNKIEPLVDYKDVGTVDITVPESFDLSDLKVTTATCSQLAHFKTDPLVLTDFANPVELYVIAENGVEKKWVITVTKAEVKEDEQVLFSSMNQWTLKNNQGISVELNGVQGMYPGDGVEVSPWNSTIQSNAYGAGYFKSFSTYPYQLKGGAGNVARVETIQSPLSIVQAMGMGLATGALFTGEFVFNPSLVLGKVKEPRKMMNFGTTFHSKPKSVKFKMRYAPGPVFMNGKGEPVAGKNDRCDIYFILQDRRSEPGTFIRIAAATYRTNSGEKIGDINDDANGFVEMDIPFIYGEPTAADLAAKKYCGIGGENGEITFYNFTPKGDGTYDVSKDPVKEVYSKDPATANVTTLIGLFSSSVDGDLFLAAPGSTLDVKDIEFVY